jgi:hypothetical protein
MTIGGWINLFLSVGAVTVLFGWCVYKVVLHNPPEHNPVEDILDPHEPKE